MKIIDIYIIMTLKQNHVNNQILVLKDGDIKRWIEILYNIKIFLFTQNNIADKNLKLGHNIKKF